MLLATQFYEHEFKSVNVELSRSASRQTETKTGQDKISTLTECKVWLHRWIKLSARLILNRILSSLVKSKLAYMDRKRDKTRIYLGNP